MSQVPLEPLEGYTVGVTADRRASEQGELLRRRGARVIDAPIIATAYLGSDSRLRAATESLVADPPDVLVITTGIGIRAWIEAAQSWGLDDALLDALADARVLSRGPKAPPPRRRSASRCGHRARRADDRSVRHVDRRRLRTRARRRAVLRRHTHDVAGSLAGVDAEITVVPVSRWQQPADVRPAEALVRATLERKVHAVTFTSAPAVRNFFSIAAAHGLHDELRDAMNTRVVACVGPTCAEAARRAGIEAPLAPPVGRLGLTVRALSERLQATRRVLQLASATVELQGPGRARGRGPRPAHATRGGCARRARSQGGGRRVRTTLLRTVWSGASGDEHVVGVTVGRLRRKLGAVGAAVCTVHRRGYRLDVAAAS